ncbi:MAG: hypothetical protein Greene101447_499 [Parcubacteria group bacterium Greene1014_47]|nr:MAG: hypothetical protein Greene101447_499 [Parcubacteria group bacterium Greene1014_47]
MLSIKNLEKFTKQAQTSIQNVVREYCQHLFLSYLYERPDSERMLFKGGTALRILLRSPRYSEDLDFTGINLTQQKIEDMFIGTLAEVERAGVEVRLTEAKKTTGGYLGIAEFRAYEKKIPLQIEVSSRYTKSLKGVRTIVENEYITAYTLVHLPIEEIIQGKLAAMASRHKARDFYDYFFLLSGNYPIVKEKENLTNALALLKASRINFRSDLQGLLPQSHARYLRDFKSILEQKILTFNHFP